ncbi:hypothetical protein [Oceanidesulfovibrio marinus]|uniref:Uncharacterized protein n=1 Tax=Oceanidesulfovibrio marinus TaxID=370038 RepID=A0A6P1ZDF1_9BACT|nr:hypothetical protein [Oceanidesulfovibrio marinus]TVM32073.1 hypothetical protein DQK91_16190 [Oceanidesulfovibrio marinus]
MFSSPTPNAEQQDTECVLTRGEFRKLVEKERCRASRFGQTFSLILFPVVSQNAGDPSANDFFSFLRSFVRLTDEIGWFNETTLGVLMAGTTRQGATFFLSRLAKVQSGEATDAAEVYEFPTESHPDLPGDGYNDGKGDHGHGELDGTAEISLEDAAGNVEVLEMLVSNGCVCSSSGVTEASPNGDGTVELRLLLPRKSIEQIRSVHLAFNPSDAGNDGAGVPVTATTDADAGSAPKAD